jgi:RND family efflux transporter MFP subunit
MNRVEMGRGLGLKKALVILAVLIVGGLFAWLVYQRAVGAPETSTHNRDTYAVAVEVTPVKRATIRDVAQFTGSLVPDSHFVVAPKVGGRLEKLFVNIGDPVERGQVVALLDGEEYRQQVEQARAEREVAKANVLESQSNLNVAKREFERVRSLRQKRIVSEAELDTAKARYEAQEAKYKVAQAQVAQREAALKAAEVRLSYTKIRASWENRDDRRLVGERFVDEGAMLKANDPIVSVLDIHPLTALIYVIEREYSRIKIGQTALSTTDAFPGQTFKGRVHRIAPLLRETSREARVEIEIPNPEGILKPGMFVRVEIEFARHDDTTVVPLNSLVRRENQRGVFVADQEKRTVRFVPVEVGIVNGDLAEVVSPPLSGSVVTLGHHLLQDGSSILLPETEADSSAPQRGFFKGFPDHDSVESKSAS